MEDGSGVVKIAARKEIVETALKDRNAILGGGRMTLRKAAKNIVRERGTYNIGFNGGDETQFDAENIDDLEDLWCCFCKEEGGGVDSVDYVERERTLV